MFERFTDDARAGRRAGPAGGASPCTTAGSAPSTCCSACCDADGDGARLLAGFGVDAAGARDEVVRDRRAAARTTSTRDALATLGIDLDAVRERVERAFGARRAERRRGRCGRVPRRRRAVHAAREEGARAVVARGDQPGRARSAPSTSLLGLAREGDGVAARILRSRGVDRAAAARRCSATAARDAADRAWALAAVG